MTDRTFCPVCDQLRRIEADHNMVPLSLAALRDKHYVYVRGRFHSADHEERKGLFN